jgi:hypothetical protein
MICSFKEILNIFPLWEFLNQPIFDSNHKLVLNPLRFWHNSKVKQLEQLWDDDYIQLLERCWDKNCEFR